MNKNDRRHGIPAEIAAKLDQSLARVRRILLFRGACAVVATAVVAMLLHMAVLAMLGEIPAAAGWAIWACAVAAVAAVAYVALVRPLSRRFTAAEVASLIERNHPELEERLSTVVELAEAGDAEASAGLVAEITSAAVRDAGSVSPKREFTSRTVKPRLAAAAAALLVLAALFAAFPKSARLLMVSAVYPSAEVANIYASDLRVAPGDATVLSGSPFSISLVDSSGGSSKAYVVTEQEGGGETRERMELVGSVAGGKTQYEFSYPRVETSFTYRAKCGRGLTRAFRVNVVEEPSFTERRIEVVHPEYTGREPSVNTKSGDIVGLAGSKVSVSVRPSRSDIEGELVLPGGASLRGTVGADGLMRFGFDLAESGDWWIALWDSNGFTGKVERLSAKVVSDGAPEVRLVVPEETSVKLPRFGELPLEWEVKEDFGVSRTVLEMCVGAGEWTDAAELASARSGSVAWSGHATVPMADKETGSAGTVRFRVRVEDTLPAEAAGPNVARSSEVTVSLVSSGTSLAAQGLRGEIDETVKSLDEIRKKLVNAKSCAGSAFGSYRQAAGNAWHADNAKKNLGWCRGGMSAAEQLLTTLAEGMEDGRLATGADLFRGVVSDHVSPTRRFVEDVFLLAREAERAVACSNSVGKIQSCIDALDAARRRYGDLSKSALALQKLEDFAKREEALAELSEEGKIDAETLAKREAELAKRFAEEFKDEIGKNIDQQKRTAEALSKRNAELEERQKDLMDKLKAAGDASEEERKALAAEEKRLADEIGKVAAKMGELKKSIEDKAGVAEADPEGPANQVEEARGDERKAQAEAKEAAGKIESGDMDGAKEDMQAASDALAEAQNALAEALGKIDEKNAEMAEGAQDFQELGKALDEAAAAAEAAAAEAAKKNAGNSDSGDKSGAEDGQKQDGDPQAGDKSGSEDGQEQDGKPQAGDKSGAEKGQKQDGKPQAGDKSEPGDKGQDGGEPDPAAAAAEAARDAMKDAAQKMREKAREDAGKKGLPIDKFEQGGDEGPDGQGQDSPNGKPGEKAGQKQGSGEGGEASDKHGDMKSDSSGSGKPERAGKKRRPPSGGESDEPRGEGDDEWFKMKGESGAGAEIDSMENVPDEYKGLVRDYCDALREGDRK